MYPCEEWMTTELVTLSSDPGAPVTRRAGGVTIDQIVQAWLDAQRASLRTRRAYADAVASFRAALQAAGHDLDAAPEAIALAAQAWAGQDDAASATYNQRLACVSSCFRYAIRHGLLRGENPIARVQRQRECRLRQSRRADAGGGRAQAPGNRP